MQAPGTVIIEVDLQLRQTKSLSVAELHINPQDSTKIYWVHCDLTRPEEFETLKKILRLPAAVSELCQERESRSRMMNTADALTILLQAPHANTLAEGAEAIVENLVIHLDEQFCFTASEKSTLTIAHLLEDYSKAVKYAKTPCFVLFLLLFEAINAYSDLLYEFQVLAEKIDFNLKNMTYDEVVEMKRQLMRTKRYISSVRDILMRISGRKMTVISEDCRTSLHSIIIHAEVLVKEAESLRGFFHTLLEQIDNALMQKLSNTMKVLTGLSAIILPLSLITGIYGMNFKWMPELSWHYGYFGALGVMMVCGLSLFYVFKRKGWL